MNLFLGKSEENSWHFFCKSGPCYAFHCTCRWRWFSVINYSAKFNSFRVVLRAGDEYQMLPQMTRFFTYSEFTHSS